MFLTSNFSFPWQSRNVTCVLFIEDTAVSASAVHEQVGPPESHLPAPAPAPVPAPRNIVKKPTPAPRKARAHVSTVQEEGNSQHKSTEQGTGTALDITSGMWSE